MITKRRILLRPEDFKPSFPGWEVDGVMNPGAIRRADGKVVLYVRVAEQHKPEPGKSMTCPVIVSHDDYHMGKEKVKRAEIISTEGNVIYLKGGICRLTNISHFRKVILNEDGVSIEKISDFPDFTGTEKEGEYGVEDARLMKIGARYYMTYVSVSGETGVSSSLAESKDLKKWNRRGIIFREQNKDAVLFPSKIKGRFVALSRPESFYEFHRPAIWISFSPDLVYWGEDGVLLLPRENSWESNRIGAGPPPLQTERGWLLFYHGVNIIDKQYIYSVGSVLLDLKNPKKILARTSKKKPLLTSNNKFETMEGEEKKVVFPTGVVLDKNGRDLIIYSGAGDRYISVMKIGLKDVFRSMVEVK
jgi:beta-1,2-mannobiose phosphorylase / 1,2-beta-oligomannan phosphorylase